jgi:hypothetical protein
MLVIVKRVHAGYIKYSVYYGWIISIILTRWSLGGFKQRKRVQSAEHHNGLPQLDFRVRFVEVGAKAPRYLGGF